MSNSVFVPSGRMDYAAVKPLLPAQAALAFVLEAETWPVFRSWLNRQFPGSSTDAEDRDDMESAFRALIEVCSRGV